MKILITCDDITTFGGIERVVANLANGFVENGNEVIIYAFGKRNIQTQFEIDKEVVIKMGDYNPISLAKPKSNFSKILREILRIFIKPINFYKRFMRDIKFQNYLKLIKPDVVLFNEYGSSNKMLKPKGKNFYKVIHGSFQSYKKFSLDNFQNFILLNSQELELFKMKYAKGSFWVIPNFISKMPQTDMNYHQKNIVNIGRMGAEKGQLRLIDIWNIVCKNANLQDWKLTIVGDGDLKGQIQAKIKELNLENSVIIKPFTNEIEKEYLQASIYAMSSYFEGLPMVLLESCSYGLVPIAFDIKTGPRDIIENEKSGFLIADNDMETYAKKLMLLMQDEEMRKIMGKEAKRIIKERFSKEVVIEKWDKLFKKRAI